MPQLFLTNIWLSRQNSLVKAELHNVYAFHQRLISLLPPAKLGEASTLRESCEVLYRIGCENNLLIQSNCLIDCDRLPYGYAEKSQFKSVEVSDRLFAQGQQMRFRLVANPVYKSSQSYKLIPISDASRLLEWIKRKGIQHGFALVGDPSFESLNPVRGIKRVGPTAQKISIDPVKYEGVLEVIDPQSFYSSVCKGIGRSKAFGCGLLSVRSILSRSSGSLPHLL
jgi:CRISPR system Cascade subunit CasE